MPSSTIVISSTSSASRLTAVPPLAAAALCCALLLGGCAPEPAGEPGGATGADATASTGTASAEGTVYGEPLADAQTVAVSDLIDNIDTYAGQQVRVEGLVTDVCQKRGCWIKVAGDRDYETVTFKVQDGVIVFPMSDRGRIAVADGVARKVDLSLEQTKKYLAHQAEEQGKEFDPASVTEPLSMVRLDGIGAVVRDAQ